MIKNHCHIKECSDGCKSSFQPMHLCSLLCYHELVISCISKESTFRDFVVKITHIEKMKTHILWEFAKIQ